MVTADSAPPACLPACGPGVVQVFVSIPACIQLCEGPYIETHEEVVKAFRPSGLLGQSRPPPAAA